MSNGDNVRLSISGRGEVIGRVEAVARPEDLPLITPFDLDTVRSILHEWEVDLVAMVSYPYGRQQLMVALLRTPAGWRDMQGQRITVERALPS